MRNPFKFFIRDPSRIIFHYFHDTHPSSEVFFILTLFSLFLRFLSILSLVFSFFFLRALSLFYASTFSSHSTIPRISLPVFPFISSSPVYNIPVYASLTTPIQSFSPSPQHLPFWFFLRSFQTIFQPAWLRSIDRSCPISNFDRLSISIFQILNFYLIPVLFPKLFTHFHFPEGWKIASENFQSRSFRLPRSSLDGNDRKLFRFLNELSRSRRRALYPFVCNTVRNTRMMARCRPIRARYRVTRAHTNTERERGGMHLIWRIWFLAWIRRGWLQGEAGRKRVGLMYGLRGRSFQPEEI